MQTWTASGKHHMNKAAGGAVSSAQWGPTLEDYFRDETKTLRSDVARAAISFIDQLIAWVSAQPGMRLIGSSLFVVFEGDSTVGEPLAPVVKILDFEHAFAGSSPEPDKPYLNGITNLRWMMERFASYDTLQTFGAEAMLVKKDMESLAEKLRINSEHAKKMKELALSMAPKASNQFANRLLYDDIRQEDVNKNVQVEQDNCLAALLQSVLVQHGINAGPEAFEELLLWKLEARITDKTHLRDVCQKYAFNDSPALLDDLMKWKASDTAEIGEKRHIVEGGMSAARVLPSYKSLMHESKFVNLVQE
eukprot:TRINITY_DN14277_c0_g1_i2.p1 TRINITY_DN14277_c0_g1~~TRINITY_DN14277_c0_g1_i2.p1  ORF type:complete len:306 (-),score=95.94 TRINITY_DN14277_c0_g1_i2:79-996(-)